MKTRTALIIAAIAAAGLLVAKVQWYPGDVFDRAQWQDQTRIADGGRKAMAERLVARNALPGRTRAEVIDMLGEPTKTDKLRKWSLVYHLGPGAPQPGAESDWLAVLLDQSGLVAEARIIRE
jgi:hypothetical protein